MSELPPLLNYTDTHLWVQTLADDLVRIGITHYAQEQLGDIMFIELPEPGRKVLADESCATIESVKTSSDIASPLAGEIININQEAIDDPAIVNDDPYNAWLFTVKCDDVSNLHNLLTSNDYLQLLNQ